MLAGLLWLGLAAAEPALACVHDAAIPAGGTCPASATTPCWKGNGSPAGSRGFRYRDREGTPDGVELLQLQPGAAGSAKIILKARGAHLAVPALPLRVQPSADGSACWEARFVADGVERNDALHFTGQSE